jgi:3-deoxy-7-phosphoheptulonate synthase
MGFKNGVAGNISAAINGALAASLPHTYMRICENGRPTKTQTAGNPDAHIVLRGGEFGPNYDPSTVSNALSALEQVRLPPRLLIDCSHENSGKNHERQAPVFQSVLHQIIEGNGNIRGLMLESHLHGGSQDLPDDLDQLQYGISITDSCLDWQSTAHLISWGAQQLHQHSLHSPLLKDCNDLHRIHVL